MIAKLSLSITVFLAATGMAVGQSTQGLQDPELIVVQPGEGEERVQLEPGSIVRYLSDGNLQVQASEEFACGDGSGDCQVELSFFTAQSGGTTVEPGQTLTVEQGDTVRFDWSARGGWECFASGLPGSGNWENDAPKAYRTFGSVQEDDSQVDTSNVAVSSTAYQSSINCIPSSGQRTETTSGQVGASESIAIVVEEPDSGPGPSPNDCSDRPSLQDLTDLERATNVLLDSQNDSEDATSFESVFNLPFPAFGVSQRKFRLFADTYASMQFTVPTDVPDTGKFTFNDLSGSDAGLMIWAMSPCEGDFNPDGLTEHCVASQVNALSSFRWTTDPNAPGARCLIEPGETYFLNIIYSEDDAEDWPVDWSCSSDRCGNLINTGP